jgi:hypothetical protein
LAIRWGGGLVASLAHPGGNVTGTSFLTSALVGKQLELLKQITSLYLDVEVKYATLDGGGGRLALSFRYADGTWKSRPSSYAYTLSSGGSFPRSD